MGRGFGEGKRGSRERLMRFCGIDLLFHRGTALLRETGQTGKAHDTVVHGVTSERHNGLLG